MTDAAPLPGGVLEIDLGAIVDNWRTLCGHHAGPVASVVKADAYGLGAARVVPALYAAGCRHFFVAHLAEALAIRALAPQAMVAVLNGLAAADTGLYVAHDIDPVLGSLDEIALWQATVARAGRPLPALLHVDTGMARLGLAEDELAEAAARTRGIPIRYVLTHLVSAEIPGDPMNATQRARFAAAASLWPDTKRSFANSSGIFLGPDFGSDLARPGAALYGINPTPGQTNPMRPTVRLRARVLQVRDVPAGETVGYNATWRARRPSRIAILPVGYADGWLRSHAGSGVARFDGARVPLVGRVSMDLTTFDVTDHEAIQAGSWLDLLAPDLTADDAAGTAGTNGYEILTSLGRRYARVYRDGAERA